MRVTATSMTARRDSTTSVRPTKPASPTSASKSGSAGHTGDPLPWKRTIRGGPSKAHSITTIRPFSRRWATVSAPAAKRSRDKRGRRGPSTANVPIGPFGETLAWPSLDSGAVPTNTGWRLIQAPGARRSSRRVRPIARSVPAPLCGTDASVESRAHSPEARAPAPRQVLRTIGRRADRSQRGRG
jgi:hypothetical protein